MASLAGVSPASVTRALNRLELAGVILTVDDSRLARGAGLSSLGTLMQKLSWTGSRNRLTFGLTGTGSVDRLTRVREG